MLKGSRPRANTARTLPIWSAWATVVRPCANRATATGWPRTTSPSAAGISSTALSRTPRSRSWRIRSSRPSTAWRDIRGSKAVITDTATTAYGSCQTINAVTYCGNWSTPVASRVRTRNASWLASWTFVYVAATQLAFLVLTRLATGVDQLPQYVTALIVWQLPYAVVAVSVITALLPRMSRHAVDGRLDLMRQDLDRGVRLSAVLLIPAALGLVVLGQPVAVALFAHGRTTVCLLY